MKPKPSLESLVYLAVIVLALIAVALALAAPSAFMQNRLIYGGF